MFHRTLRAAQAGRNMMSHRNTRSRQLRKEHHCRYIPGRTRLLLQCRSTSLQNHSTPCSHTIRLFPRMAHSTCHHLRTVAPRQCCNRSWGHYPDSFCSQVPRSRIGRTTGCKYPHSTRAHRRNSSSRWCNPWGRNSCHLRYRRHPCIHHHRRRRR